MLELVLLGILVAALWALGPILQKIVMSRGISSTTIIVLGGIFSIVFGAVCLVFKRHELIADFHKIDAEVLMLIAGAAIVCGIVASYMFLHILKKYDAYLVNALAYTSPIFTIIFTFWLLGEPVTWMSIVGIFVIMGGVMLTVMGTP